MTSTVTPVEADRSEPLMERLFEATIGTLELFSIHVGRRLGLYQALADGLPRTADTVAIEAGIAPRYAREWLEQQAVAGLIDISATDVQEARRYVLAPDQARVLLHVEDATHVAPFASMVAGIGQALPDVVHAYRTGAGVPYTRYGADFRDGQGAINRPSFTHDLVADWLPSIPEVHARLTAGAQVADVGCGIGWSTQAVARAYPNSRVVGIDADDASVTEARAALDAQLADRVDFVAADAGAADRFGPFDIVLLLEALHDFGDPVAGLTGIRSSLADGGVVLVADERVAETFTAPGDQVERMMFGWSVTHCLPAAIADGDHTAIGTAIRPDTVRQLAAAAGFGRVEVLPIDNDLFRFYGLTP